MATLAATLGLTAQDVPAELRPFLKERVVQSYALHQNGRAKAREAVIVTLSGEWYFDVARKELTRLGRTEESARARRRMGPPRKLGLTYKATYQLPLPVGEYLRRLAKAQRRSKNECVTAAVGLLYNALGRPGQSGVRRANP